MCFLESTIPYQLLITCQLVDTLDLWLYVYSLYVNNTNNLFSFQKSEDSAPTFRELVEQVIQQLVKWYIGLYYAIVL